MTAGHIETQLGGVPEYLRMKPVNVNIDVSDRRWRKFVDDNSSDMILMTVFAILITKLQIMSPIFNWSLSLKSLIYCYFGDNVILMTVWMTISRLLIIHKNWCWCQNTAESVSDISMSTKYFISNLFRLQYPSPKSVLPVIFCDATSSLRRKPGNKIGCVL